MKFVWGEEKAHSFQKLNEAITEATLLVFPKEAGESVLTF